MKSKVDKLYIEKLETTKRVYKLAQANFASKNDIASFAKKSPDFVDQLKNLNKKVTSNKTKHVLVENELDKLSEKS